MGLITAASCVGGYIYGHHWKQMAGMNDGDLPVDVINQITSLKEENQQLRDDAIALRKLAESGGDFLVEEEYVSFVEEALSLKFKDKPKAVKAQNDTEMQESVAAAWVDNFSEEGIFIRERLVYPAIGIMPPNNRFLPQISLAHSNGARTLYDYDSKIIFIALDFDKESFFDQKSLIKSLAVCLLEQHYANELPLTDDQFFARRAIIFGAAANIENRYIARVSRMNQSLPMRNNTPAMLEIAETLNSMAYYVRQVTKFPNNTGKEFVDIFTGRNPEAPLSEAIQVGHSTQALMVPLKNFSVTKLREPRENEIVLTQLGALSVLTHFEQTEPERKDLITLLKNYEHDELSFVRTSAPDDRKVLAGNVHWIIDFSDDEAAEIFLRHLNDGMIPESSNAYRKEKSVHVTAEVSYTNLKYRKPE